MHIIFLLERCDKSLDVIYELLAFPTIILQLVYRVLKRTYTSHNRTEWSHFVCLNMLVQTPDGRQGEKRAGPPLIMITVIAESLTCVRVTVICHWQCQWTSPKLVLM